MKLLLSIKPEYAEKILLGKKKYEFRRTIFKNEAVSKVIIYATSPIKKIIGEFEIEDILTLNTFELWEKTMKHSGINKEFYDDYFSGKDKGHAIKIRRPKRYPEYMEKRMLPGQADPVQWTLLKEVRQCSERQPYMKVDVRAIRTVPCDQLGTRQSR